MSSTIMVRNFFKITFRSLWRNKSFSFINITGLAIGMAAAILILIWVQNEISFDRFHAKSDRISILYSREDFNGKMDAWGRTPALMAPELKRTFAEVEDAVRYNQVYFLVSAGEKKFNLAGAFADSGFLSMFSYPLLEGNVANALHDDHSIVVTQKLARKLFGNDDPMGKTIRIDSNDHFTVTGLLKDLPANTELDFEYLLPWTYQSRLGWDNGQTWAATNAYTYVLLKEGASPVAFDGKIRRITKDHVKIGEGSKREVFLQPLVRKHLFAKVENGKLVAGRMEMVRLFIVIAIFILVIACINFMNLSTAKSEERAREVGIRKAIGANRGSLIAQFIAESILLSFIAFLIALFLVQISLDAFNNLVGSQLTLAFQNYFFWIYALGFILITGFLAGSYPAFYLSSFLPVGVLKKTFHNVHALVTPRKILVVLQFSFALVLIICTIVVERQIQFAMDRDAGYKKDKLVFHFAQGEIDIHYDLIKQALINSGAAVSVTRINSPITRVWSTVAGFSWPGSSEQDEGMNFLQFAAGADFVNTIGLQLAEGRDLDISNYHTDSNAVLLNEAAVTAMHIRDPLGKMIKGSDGVNREIVGVLKNFVIESPYDVIKPTLIKAWTGGYGAVHFKLNPANSISDNLIRAEKIFRQYNPQYPFEYYFVDETYARKFREERQQGSLAGLFAGLAVFISCLGLFGLSIYMAESRVKEIGVRKVLGASVGDITILLSGDFIRLVLIAVIVASPIAWFVMDKWLSDFSYRVSMSVWLFLVAGLLVVMIALITVAGQAIRAAMSNPVNSLRSE